MSISAVVNFLATLTGLGSDGIAIGDFFKKRFGKQKQNEEKTNVQLYYEKMITDFVNGEDSDATERNIISSEKLNLPNTYLEAYTTKDSRKPISQIIDTWCRKTKNGYGVMVLHGAPGHGKTTLCHKAVFDYCRGNRFFFMKNVFWFRLNPAYNEILQGNKLEIEKAFCFGRHRTMRKSIPLADCEGSLVFLDGYDELKQQAANTNINTFDKFYREVKALAEAANMHIVITARTQSIKNDIEDIPCVYEFAPLTYKQQDHWIHARPELHDYEADFRRLRAQENMWELLGIPILFRMVVNCRFKETADTVVELYDKLFDATMLRQEHSREEIEKYHRQFEKLAMQIFWNDDTSADISAEIEGGQYNNELVYKFYTNGDSFYHIEFIHRSFYQYFLANGIYRKLAEAKDEASAADFLCSLADREVDRDVLAMLKQVDKLKGDARIEAGCRQVMQLLEWTDGILIDAYLTQRKISGNSYEERFALLREKENSYLGLCRQLTKNALKIFGLHCLALSRQKVEWKDYPRVCRLFAKYRLKNIWGADLHGADLRGADLRKADLSEADLSEADLLETNLHGANLSGADLRGANLRGADLRKADLRRAMLSAADLLGANLSGAHLSGAHLSGAHLSRADLSGANLSRADLSGAILSEADLREADLREADLNGADLCGAYLFEAFITKEQLMAAKSIKGCRMLFKQMAQLGLQPALPEDRELYKNIIWCDDKT